MTAAASAGVVIVNLGSTVGSGVPSTSVPRSAALQQAHTPGLFSDLEPFSVEAQVPLMVQVSFCKVIVKIMVGSAPAKQ